MCSHQLRDLKYKHSDLFQHNDKLSQFTVFLMNGFRGELKPRKLKKKVITEPSENFLNLKICLE